MNRIRKHPYIAQALITLLVAMIVVAGFYMTTETFGEIGTDLILFIIYSLFLGVFFIYPLVATIYEGIILAVTAGGKPETGNRLNHSASSGIYDILLLFLAGVYEVVYISFVKNVAWQADWQTQLANAERHAPIWPETWPGMLVLLLAAVTGLFFSAVFGCKKSAAALDGACYGSRLSGRRAVCDFHLPGTGSFGAYGWISAAFTSELFYDPGQNGDRKRKGI